jgi:hypothetical protein
MELKQLGPNMTELIFKGVSLLFSYETPVAGYKHQRGSVSGLFKTERKYSRTTTRHINKYLKEEWDVDPKSVEIVSQDYIEGLVS